MDPLIAVGQPAPLFRLPDLNGNWMRLEQARGKILIINFWSAECPWSERTDRDLLAALAGWGTAVLLWTVACNANEPAAQLRQIALERGLPVLLHDPDQRVADLYGAVTTPHLVIIDANGTLRYQGAPDDVTFRQRVPTRFWAQAAVEALLAGRSPDPDHTSAYGCAIVRFSSPSPLVEEGGGR
jgi:peroxiredoxin